MHSLRWRFLVPFAILLIFALGGLSLYLSQFIRETTLETARGKLLNETNLVADQAAQSFSADTRERQSQMENLATLLQARITLILPDGTVVSDTSANPEEMDNHLSRPEVQQALSGQPGSQVRRSATLDQQMLYAAAPIRQNNQIIAVARLAVPIDAIESSLVRIRTTLLVGTGLLIILALGLTYLLTNYTINPLERLTLAVQKLGSGEFSDTFLTDREDEIGQLNQAFTKMAFQLNTKIVELETERGKLAAVLTNMTDGVLIVDTDGTIQLINPAAARMFRTTIETASQHGLVEVTRQHQLAALWQQSRSGADHQTSLVEISLDKLFLQAVATSLDELLPGSTLLLLQDFTHVRRLETVRRDFVSNVSHELRTPLASLKALTETLQEGALEDPPAARRFLSQMENEIDNLTQMVRELLELSRIESGRVPLMRKRISPYVLVENAVNRMRLQAERAGLQLSVEMPDGLPDIALDSQRMEQVFGNLLHNATKFTLPGGRIIVSAYLEERNIVFTIQDTGTGISPEDLDRIFERFYKADRARSGGGTGLGLSISRHLIEAHGGRIWAESTIGVGSKFFFSIPLSI